MKTLRTEILTLGMVAVMLVTISATAQQVIITNVSVLASSEFGSTTGPDGIIDGDGLVAAGYPGEEEV